MWLIVRQQPMKASWWDAPLTIQDLAEAMSITRNSISYSLIEPQPLLCIPACGCKFYALVLYPQSTFTAPPVWSSNGNRSEVCFGAFLQKQSQADGCFCRGAPSLVFDEILNVRKKLSVWGEDFHHWSYTGES